MKNTLSIFKKKSPFEDIQLKIKLNERIQTKNDAIQNTNTPKPTSYLIYDNFK